MNDTPSISLFDIEADTWITRHLEACLAILHAKEAQRDPNLSTQAKEEIRALVRGKAITVGAVAIDRTINGWWTLPARASVQPRGGE